MNETINNNAECQDTCAEQPSRKPNFLAEAERYQYSEESTSDFAERMYELGVTHGKRVCEAALEIAVTEYDLLEQNHDRLKHKAEALQWSLNNRIEMVEHLRKRLAETASKNKDLNEKLEAVAYLEEILNVADTISERLCELENIKRVNGNKY